MPDRRLGEAPKKPLLDNEQVTASVVDTLKANEHVSREDPARALEEMQEFLEARGPHPQLLSRIAVLQRQLGKTEALETARKAGRLAISLGNNAAVAELLAPFQDQWDELEWENEQWLKLASAQRSTGHPQMAQQIYRYVLENDPGSLNAVKGLLQIADGYLRKKETRAQAIEVYDILDALVPEHPFQDYVEMGREKAKGQPESVR